MKPHPRATAAVLTLLVTGTGCGPAPEHYDVVIRGGTVIDGVGRLRTGDRAVRRLALAAAILVALQLAVAADMIMRALPQGPRAVHVGLGATVFASLVALAWFVGRPTDSVA